jgi:hypothetical protein
VCNEWKTWKASNKGKETHGQDVKPGHLNPKQ